MSHDYGIKRNNSCETALSCNGMWWVLINVYILPLLGKFLLSFRILYKVYLWRLFNPSMYSWSEPNKIHYIHVYYYTDALIILYSNYSLLICHSKRFWTPSQVLYIFNFKTSALIQVLICTKNLMNPCWWMDKRMIKFPVSKRSGKKLLFFQNTFGSWQTILEIFLMKGHLQTWISPFKQERLKGLCHEDRKLGCPLREMPLEYSAVSAVSTSQLRQFSLPVH